MLFSKLADVALVGSGSAIMREGSDSRAVMVGDLDGSGILPPELTAAGSPKSRESAQLQPDDIVVSLRGGSNFAAVVEPRDIADWPLFATLDLAVIRPREFGIIDPRYLTIFLNLPSTQKTLSAHRLGTAALRLPLGPLREFEIPIPTYGRQQIIVALADAAAEERRLSKRLAELRSELISELLRQAAADVSAPAIVPHMLQERVQT